MLKLTVKNGIDNLEKYDHLFSGKRLGLITNHTGLSKSFRPTADILHTEYDLKVLFAPEHGLRGAIQAGDAVKTCTDEQTKLPVYSLYGETKKPAPGMLKNIDVLVYDIQDIGSRYYTYIYTMALAMESCAESGKTFVVLDRINPVGSDVEGNILDLTFKSFVGLYALPVRHGLTAGELAGLINREYHIGARLEVIPVEGWSRDRYLDETDLPWVNPTPNMTSVDCAVLYAGTCIFEGTNISEGRGTTRPFEIVGAPWIDPYRLAERMNEQGLQGVFFRPMYFTPVFSKHKNNPCGGVQMHITDRNRIEPVECGLRLLYTIKSMSGDQFAFLPPVREGGRPFIDLLAGTDKVRLAETGNDIEMLLETWKKDCSVFLGLKEKYKLY